MNIPNALSIFRLLLIPVFITVFFSDSQYAYYYAALVYAIAALTDVLDGIIARRFGLITRLGRLLDPLADKLMAFTVLVCIFIDGIAPTWAVIVFFCKEALMGIGALVLFRKTSDVMPSDKWGKGATACFFVVCLILMLFRGISPTVANIMLALPLLMSVIALFHYYKLYIANQPNHKPAKGE